MKNFIYFFYRLRSYYNNQRLAAFIVLGGLINLKVLSIALILSSIFNFDLNRTIRVDYGLIDRFVILPLLLTSVYIGVYMYYKLNRKRIEKMLFDFSYETKELSKKRGKLVLCYIFGSLLFFLIGISSIGWIKYFK